jgi:anti-sigma B factor antagonist
MSRIVFYPEAVVVEMHDQPCFTDEDTERVKQTLCQAGRQRTRLVVDCAAVHTLGGAFLGALLTAMKRLAARPGDIVLCNVQPLPLEVFRITHLDRVFPLCATRDDALAALWPEPAAQVVESGGPDPLVGP